MVLIALNLVECNCIISIYPWQLVGIKQQ